RPMGPFFRIRDSKGEEAFVELIDPIGTIDGPYIRFETVATMSVARMPGRDNIMATVCMTDGSSKNCDLKSDVLTGLERETGAAFRINVGNVRKIERALATDSNK
ncbi:MAG TPA: hypothetical protein VHE81_05100, partial [Lacipirellulaceae bacterium]|nr:hypothetical protein [Lacipirellulaceae bacterium]